MIDKLLSYLLKHAEGSPEARFYESELTGISSAGFTTLKKQKHLIFDQYDFEGENYFDKRGNERFVRKLNGKWIATSTEDSGIAPIYLKDQDLNRYTFSMQPLLDQMRVINKLEETIDQISARLYFVGSAELTDGRIGIYVGLFDSVESLEEAIRGLPGRVSTYIRHIVITPSLKIKKQSILKDLERIKVRQLSFAEVFQSKDFKFKVNALASGISDKQPFSLKITGIMKGKGRSRKHLVKVAGKDGELTDALFIILLRFVEGVMKTKSGEVAVSALTSEGVVHEDGYKQYIGRLREKMNALFPDYNFHELIENREGSYRLAVSKDAIDYDLPMLKKLKDNGKVETIVKRLPKPCFSGGK